MLHLVRLTFLGSSCVVAPDFRFFGFLHLLLVPDCGSPIGGRAVSSLPTPKGRPETEGVVSAGEVSRVVTA